MGEDLATSMCGNFKFPEVAGQHEAQGASPKLGKNETE